MVTSELGACEWFVWDLRRSNLIDRGQLDQIVSEFLAGNPGAEPPALADFLVRQNILTQFQADRLLQGKTQGFILGPYTLHDALGAGSMGTVYKAQSKTDNRWFAVKVLPRRSMWNVRLARRKVRSFEQCKHPAVVPFLDVGTSGGMHYLAWPLVEGETLDKIVQRQGKLSTQKAVQYALQTAQGLEVCHRQELFHGLLKPSNLMIDSAGQVHILDLGIGSLLAETEGESLVDTMSTANSVASGLDCASPESIMDPTKLTPVGDQYSLGCVLYYCLSGRFPFTDDSAAAKMMAHQFKTPPPIRELVPGLPESLAEVIERLMQKQPEARYASTTDVIAALQEIAGPVMSDSAPPPPRSAPPRPTAPVFKSLAEIRRPGSSAQTETPPELARPDPMPRRNPVPPAAPTRRSMREEAAAPPQAPAAPDRPAAVPPQRPQEPEPSSDNIPASQIPGLYPGKEQKASIEERLGPVGITVIAVLLCGLAWFISMRLFP